MKKPVTEPVAGAKNETMEWLFWAAVIALSCLVIAKGFPIRVL